MIFASFKCSLNYFSVLYRHRQNGHVCMRAALLLPRSCEGLSCNHSLKLVSRRGRYLAASSCQDIIYVTQQIYNMTTPLHNTQELTSHDTL